VNARAQAVEGFLQPQNPATLEPVGTVPVTPPEAVAEAVTEARLAQAAWGREPLHARERLLGRAVHALLESVDEVADTIVGETGKPVVEALTTELFVALDNAWWLSKRTRNVLRPRRLPIPQLYLPHKRAWLQYEPVGVAAVLSPWNFPFSIPFTQVAMAVAAGNAVVVKPSELTPLSGAWVEEIFRRAGAPPGLVRVVQGPGETTGDTLLRHRGVGAIVFTGSTEVGRIVAARAAERLCPVILELGGKDPMLVLDDADLDRAVEGALWGSFANCGQVCSGVERIYVEGAQYDRFVAELAARARSLRIGDGHDPGTDLGPLVSAEQRDRVENLIVDALERGAALAAGGGRPDVGLPGWFHEPTVLAGEPGGARIAEEEIFGPVVTVAKIANEEDGIRRANASAHALGASVWTRDLQRARRVAARLEAGSVWTNDHAYSYGLGQAPWGGRKQSGVGRTHSAHGLYALTHVTYLDADAGRLAPPWWYPYGEAVEDGFRGALGVLYGDGARARLRALTGHRRGLAALGKRAIRR
jgi:succinate-semialdehyde dehydrogenase/glutarate-semialdehyde dehydrogenase